MSAFSLYLGICIAAVFSLGTGIFMRPLLEFLGAGENTYGYASQYAFCVIVLGGVPTVAVQRTVESDPQRGLLQGGGCRIMLGGILNIALDPLFMFVLLPTARRCWARELPPVFPTALPASFFWPYWRGLERNRELPSAQERDGPERESIVSVFSVGIPSAVSSFLFDVDYMIIDRLMVSYHDLALAAIGIVLKVERFPLNVGIGICQGMLPWWLTATGPGRKSEWTTRSGWPGGRDLS